MTVLYWAGGEDISFASISFFTGNPTNPTTLLYRATYARAAVFVSNSFASPDTTFPLTNYATTPNFGSLSSLWVHGQFSIQNGSNATVSNGIWLAAYDSTGVARLVIRGTGTAGQVKISKVDSSGTFTDLATSAAGALNFVLPNPNPCPLDFFINYAVSGQATVYWNGINICDTGSGVNVTTNSVTSLSQVSYSLLNVGGGLNYQGWSECAVQDTTTLGLVLQTLPPLAPGNTQNWTGSVGNIDEVAINLANFNFTAANNELSEWTLNTSLPAGTWNIVAVVQAAALSAGSTGPQHFAWVVRASSPADFTKGTIALSTGVDYYQSVWMTNPATTTAWTAGQLINSGIESLA